MTTAYISDFVSVMGTEVGGLAPFPYNAPNSFTQNNRTWLKTGVVVLASAYPNFPVAIFPAITTFGTSTPITKSIANITIQAFGNGLFVGNDGTNFYSSPDGITWTNRGNATNTSTWNSPVYTVWTGTTFIAGGFHGMWTSPDGITWTTRTVSTNMTGGSSSMATNGTTTLFQYGSTNTRKSINNTTWADVTAPALMTGLAYGAGLFVMTSASGIYSSPDGATGNWTLRNVSTVGGVAFGNGVFVTSQGSLRSTDGITWTVVSPPIVTNGSNIQFLNNIFVCTANSSAAIQTSTDGLNWRNIAAFAGNLATVSHGAIAYYGNSIYLFNGSTGLSAYTYASTAAYIDNFTLSAPAFTPALGTLNNSPAFNYTRIS